MNDKKTITIVTAEQQDYTNWLPLWLNYQKFYRTKISEEVTKLTWERFLTPCEPVYCAVAKYDGQIVGLVHYLFHRSTWTDSNYCYLEDLFVSEDVRGQHIGKQLIEYVQQEAQKHHASRLYWHTHETNLRGQRLYDWVAKKSGMIEYRM
ncbi:N-acetyltransferase family protein [Citrobacter meridianamericanus]|uniref:GNAT family N-acetyltransferase n=1 Tax=Citrobacter meridianamericanus TaxID=2894201 RepID=UPI00351D73E5